MTMLSSQEDLGLVEMFTLFRHAYNEGARRNTAAVALPHATDVKTF